MLFEDMTANEVQRSIILAENDSLALLNENIVRLKEFYDNDTKPVKAPSMSGRIYEGRLEAYTPLAYTALLVDKIAALVYSRNVNRTIAAKEAQTLLTDAYRGTQSAFIRIAKLSSLYGFGALRIRRDWLGQISLASYGADEVRPIFNPEDMHGKPLGLVFTVNTKELPPWVASQLKGKRKHSYVFSEMITRHERDSTGNIVHPGVYRVFVDDKEVTTRHNGLNPLGDYLGAVYWRGLDHPFNPYGKSDILPVLSTLESINELMTDGRELMVWGLHSPVITNIPGDLNWNYSPRAIWKFKTPASGIDFNPFIQRLGGATDSIKDFKVFIELLMNMFHQTTRIPSVSVGDLNGIGKASSGRAFEIAMTPAKELVAEKENTAGPQELLLMEEILAKGIYYDDLKGRTYNYRGVNMPDPKYLFNIMKGAAIEFAPIAIPQESSAETRSSQVTSDIKSRETAIREMHPGWTSVEVDAEMKRIDDEGKAGEGAE